MLFSNLSQASISSDVDAAFAATSSQQQ